MGKSLSEQESFPNGFTTLGNDNPTSINNFRSKRKQTLLSLLDMLNELTREGDLGDPGYDQQPSFEDDHDVPTVDEHLQKVGAETFAKFERRIQKLDSELRSFANSARQLGSSVGILSSSFRLRERLVLILHLFRENAASLFPRKVASRSREELLIAPHVRPRRKQKASGQVAVPGLKEDVGVEDFPEQLEGFADDVITFLDCLNEFPEFTDESINASIIALEGDLRYWGSCLKAYRGQYKYPAVQRYLHDLTAEMGEHLDSINSSLSVFIDIGVPTIRAAQKHAAANLLNLSTVATFFSAVTATTMQFSFDQTDTTLANSVNGFWFTSLVFSIGAAVNSLLGVTWKQAMYRSPGHRVPWWVLIWIKRSPLVFLVLSVACFSMGLVLFAYSSGQHMATSTLTTVFSALDCFGLAAVSCWFACERWIWTRHKGQKWLADVLSETRVQLNNAPGIAWFIREPRNAARILSYWTRQHWSDFRDQVTQLLRTIRETCFLRTTRESDLEVPMEEQSSDPKSPIEIYAAEHFSSSSVHRPSTTVLGAIPEHAPSTTDGEATVVNDAGTAPNSPIVVSSPKPPRLKQVVRSVMMMKKATPPAIVASASRKRTMSSDEGKGKTSEKSILSRSRVAALVPRLKAMDISQEWAAHIALVRHIQFSPDGKFLATSSWDRTSMIYRVGEPFTIHRTLAHPAGFVSQVAWSPNGKSLLTKLVHGVKVWTEDGVCRKTIDRHCPVQSVAWFPHGEAFLSVETGVVTKLNLSGEAMETYRLDRMSIHDVAVTQDSSRMLCVGVLLASADGLKPKRSRAEKQIIVYNFERKEIENRVPVLHEVRDITLTRPIQGREQVALVSYENKAPPQLWKIEVVSKTDTARLSLRHTYMPKSPVDFAGPSYFGGKNDELVLCAGKGGDIHIWDCDSAALLHYIRPQALGGGDLTCIAWNHLSDSFMFAAGSHDGAVRIWASPGTLPDDGSRANTHPSNTPRTASPSLYDADYRSESPSVTNSQDDRVRKDNGKSVAFSQNP